ncbi:MAG: Type 4 prepilin-like proteins leader peptide-processing enzyme [Stygiobacter sp.]|nr:MAG: Type 4 prepilin-like proteins leader peptide-processing enzyme [Stygiobacter sp.]KAF0214120.1 MAG: Type 4 prepilin-like proteins leader peptide-processing [Ignavibacteria bacterium]
MKMIILTLFILYALGNLAYLIIIYFLKKHAHGNSIAACSCHSMGIGINVLQLLIGPIAHSNKCEKRNKNNLTIYLIIQLMTISYGMLIFSMNEGNVFLFTYGYILLCIAVIDYNLYIIPNVLVVALLISGLIKNYVFHESMLLGLLISLIVGSVFILVNRLTNRIWKRESIGLGDIKLLVALSFYWSYEIFAIGLWLSAIIAIPGFYLIKMISERHMQEKRIPFGFFLGVVFSIMVFYNNELIVLYLKFIGE